MNSEIGLSPGGKRCMIDGSVESVSFFIGYGTWMIWKFLSITMLSFPEGSHLHTGLHLTSYAFLGLSLLSALRFDRESLPFFAGSALGVLVWIASDNIVILDLVLLLHAGRNIEFRQIAKFTFILVSALSLVIVVGSQVGALINYPFSRGSNGIRWGLGFRYCTYLSHLYLNLVMLYVYLRSNHLYWFEYLIIVIVDLLIYIATDSRNSFFLVILLLLFSLMLKVWSRRDWLKKALVYGFRYGFVAVTVFSLVIALAYNPSSDLWKDLNTFSSNRFAQDHASLLTYGVTPFGQDIEFAGNSLEMGGSLVDHKSANQEADRNVVENSLLNTLVNMGGFSLAAVLYALFRASWYAEYRRDYLACAIFVALAAHSVFDPQLLNLLYTTFLFYVWNALISHFGKDRRNRQLRNMGIRDGTRMNSADNRF